MLLDSDIYNLSVDVIISKYQKPVSGSSFKVITLVWVINY